jgi:hypothetical protein
MSIENNRFRKWLIKSWGPFVTGDNCERGKAQREAVESFSGFLSVLMATALTIGMGIAFGAWAFAVVGIIVFASMLSGRKQ